MAAAPNQAAVRPEGQSSELIKIKAGWFARRSLGISFTPVVREAPMTTTGLAVFDKTLQETNAWLKIMMSHLKTDDRERAYAVMKGTLHALRDRIGPENASHLGAQLPLLLRGVFYEGWHIAGTPTKERHLNAFLEHVANELPKIPKQDPEEAARATLNVMKQRLDPGEFNKLARMLPQELRRLWPTATS
jgi:uncharacterized protein (DUF2267 family)